MEYSNWSLSSDGSVQTQTAPVPAQRSMPFFDQYIMTPRSGFSSAGAPMNPRAALSLAAYFSAINVLSTDLASLPIHVYRKRKSGGRDKVSDDPRERLLDVSPDGDTTGMRQRQAMMGHVLGWGNGYLDIVETQGEVTALKLAEPTAEPVHRQIDNELYYLTTDGDTRRKDQFIHIAGFGYDGLKGYSPARLQANALRLTRNAEVFGTSFFDNGIRASGYFEAPHAYDKQKSEEFRGEMTRMFAGSENAARFMILWNNWKWTQSTIPPEEAQFLQTRAFQILEICRMFRLPPNKLQDYSQAHYANIEESNIDYLQTVLVPWCTQIEQAFNLRLFTPQEQDQGYFVKHNLNAFLRGNATSRAAFYTSMFGLGVFTIDDIREYEDMNPIGDFGSERFLTVQAKPLRVEMLPVGAGQSGTGKTPAPTEGQMPDVASLVEVLSLVASGDLPPASAKALLAASFPALTSAQIDGMIDPIEVKPPAPAPVPPALPAPNAPPFVPTNGAPANAA
jgi:HK97 family phage portal protein